MLLVYFLTLVLLVFLMCISIISYKIGVKHGTLDGEKNAMLRFRAALNDPYQQELANFVASRDKEQKNG